MTVTRARVEFDADRITEFLTLLEQMAAGDTGLRLNISERHDELDALAHGVNVLVGELAWATARAVEAHKERAAAAERSIVSKDLFLRDMSHEIRTPIAAMLGFADLLASSDQTPRNRPELLRRLRANGQAVLSLLDNLLDIAKLDADKIALKPESVSVVDLVHEVYASLEIDSQAKGLAMRVDTSGDTLGTVCTDRYGLRQILVNLVANAVKFTPAGTVVMRIASVRDATDERWTIDIADTGIGIAADRHPHLFQPFEQANASIPMLYGGHGLGLLLSRKLAEQLGGSLALVRSAPGKGTVFRLTLRPLPAAPMAGPSPTRPADRVDGAFDGLRILLAEDHPDLHVVLRQLLEESGAAVTSAHDGREAVAKAGAATFDLVLMDLRMPVMDGLQATRAMRDQGMVIPIVALTADAASLHQANALDAGCDACLSKPFTLDELLASIQASSRPIARSPRPTAAQRTADEVR